MGADEEATIETLTAYRKVFLSHIQGHRDEKTKLEASTKIHFPMSLRWRLDNLAWSRVSQSDMRS